MEPPDADSHYTEHLVRLPNLGFSYTPLEVPRTSITREFFELPRDSVLYLCSHALFTFLPQHDEIFPRIAQEVPNSKFIFISHPKGTGVTENFRKRIHQSFSQFNLNADNHVVFLPPLDAGKYHAINCISDVFLDSIGWSSYNSALEALACDLPVLTLPGTLMRQRHSTAILNMMGITETIASNTYEYTSMAVRLGKDIEWRRSLSQKIAADKHKLYGDRECIAGLEDFLIKAAKG
jgi:predicted O-linked N-acetylglucosamine transferase (SPINDLY family)